MKKLSLIVLLVLFLAPIVLAQEKYVVKKGDWLTTIALEYGVGWRSIYEANPQIKNPDLIYPGQLLVIPVAKTLPQEAKEIYEKIEEAKRLAEVAVDQAEINAEKSQKYFEAARNIFLYNKQKPVVKKVRYNSDITIGGSFRQLNDKEADLYFNLNNVFRGAFSTAKYLPGEIKYTPAKFRISKVISIDPLLVGLADYNLLLGRNKSPSGLVANFDPRVSFGLNIDIEYKNFFTSFDVYGPTLDISGKKWLESYDSQTLEIFSEYKFNKDFSTSFSMVYLWNGLGAVDWFYLLNWYKGGTSFKAGFGQRYYINDRQFEMMIYASRLFKMDFFKQLL